MTLWPEIIFLIDDAEGNIINFKELPGCWNTFMHNVRRDTRNILGIPPERKALLLASEGHPTQWENLLEQPINHLTCNDLIKKLQLLNRSALLLLDYEIVPSNFEESKKYLRDIIHFYGPSVNRILIVASAHTDAWPFVVENTTAEMGAYLVQGRSVGTRDGLYASLGCGLGLWLELNSRPYDAFVSKLMLLDHDFGKYPALLECFGRLNYAPPRTCLNLQQRIEWNVLHKVATCRAASYQALWLLALVAYLECFPGANDVSTIFNWDEFVNSESTMDRCLPSNARNERQNILSLFGELCRKMMVHKTTSQSTLSKVTVTKESLSLDFMFAPTYMNAFIANGIAGLRTKWGAESKNTVGRYLQSGPPVTVEHHEVTDLLIGIWLALQHVSGAYNDGENMFGGAQLSARALRNNGAINGTEVSFHD